MTSPAQRILIGSILGVASGAAFLCLGLLLQFRLAYASEVDVSVLRLAVPYGVLGFAAALGLYAFAPLLTQRPAASIYTAWS
jgi:hypothetical protein